MGGQAGVRLREASAHYLRQERIADPEALVKSLHPEVFVAR
jgi:hypothetical protein